MGWSGARGLRLLGGLLVLVGLTSGLIALWDEVQEPAAQHFDERVLRALRRPGQPERPRGPAWLPEAARDVTALGSPSVLLLLVLAVAGALLLVRHYRTCWLVLASTLGGWGANALLKHLFARPRPSVVPHLTPVLGESFPSGHAMLSAIVFLTLGTVGAQLTGRRWLRAYFLGVALMATVLVGLSRVYLGVHYPSDVLGGWMAGLAWALLVGLVARAARRRSPALREEARAGYTGGGGDSGEGGEEGPGGRGQSGGSGASGSG